MLNQEENFDDLDDVVEGEGADDPFYGPITADEEADPEDEAVLAEVMDELSRLMYQDQGADQAAAMIQSGAKTDLFQIIPDIAIPMIQKGYEIANEIDPASAATVTFGEEGLITRVNDMLFELALQVGHPDAQDQDNYMASLTSIYKKVGEHIEETGDEEAKLQVAQLATDMTLATPEGQKAAASAPKEKPIAGAIKGALGGAQ